MLSIDRHRTSFHLKVDLDKFEAVDMTGKTAIMPGVLEDLKDYVKMQVYVKIYSFLHLRYIAQYVSISACNL